MSMRYFASLIRRAAAGHMIAHAYGPRAFTISIRLAIADARRKQRYITVSIDTRYTGEARLGRYRRSASGRGQSHTAMPDITAPMMIDEAAMRHTPLSRT